MRDKQGGTREGKRCKSTLFLFRHKIIMIKGYGYRCKYCGKTVMRVREEAKR